MDVSKQSSMQADQLVGLVGLDGDIEISKSKEN